MKPDEYAVGCNLGHIICYGLRIRDYIAIEAMKSIISSNKFWIPFENTSIKKLDVPEISRISYLMADEMIKKSNET